GRHVDLDVRSLQSSIAAQEDASEQSRACHQPASSERVLYTDHQFAQPAARQIVQCDGPRKTVAAVSVEVVVQVGADRGHVTYNGDADVIQHIGRPEAGKLQQMRRAISAAGDNNLFTGT